MTDERPSMAMIRRLASDLIAEAFDRGFQAGIAVATGAAEGRTISCGPEDFPHPDLGPSTH